MSSFWHWWVVILTLANILAMVWLIRWTEKPRPGEAGPGETTGHVYDGDLTEYNNPMPRWWLYLFYLTIVFGLVYLVLYPGLGNFQGLLGWSSASQYEAEVEAVEERIAPIFEGYAERDLDSLSHDDTAMATGRRLFANECAVCHGVDGRGAPGFPNIANDRWQWGGDPEEVRETILEGRRGNMPALGGALEDDEIEAVIAYVLHLAGEEVPEDKVEPGGEVFQAQCAFCHGAEGEGMKQLGAPDLTDGYWTYGGSREAIRETIVGGRRGEMPAFADRLGEQRVHVLAAYVLRMNREAAETAEAAE